MGRCARAARVSAGSESSKKTHKEQLPAQLSGAAIGKFKDAAEGLVVAFSGALETADAAGDVCELAGAEGGLGGVDDGVEVRAGADGEELAQVADGETADGAQVCAVDGGGHEEGVRDVTGLQDVCGQQP